jgi:hypothetical protein
MSDRNFERNEERKSHAPKELSFDQLLDQMSPAEIRARMRAVGKELAAEEKKHPKAEQTAHKESNSLNFSESSQTKSLDFSASRVKSLDFSESKSSSSQSSIERHVTKEVKHQAELQSSQMTYDKASNTYVTNDGNILHGGANPEIATGMMLQESLNKVAQVQKNEAHLPSVRPAELNQFTSIDNALVSLPYSTGGLDYRGMARTLPVGQLYGPENSSCSEVSVNADVSILGFAGGGMTIYDQQNDECRLAQTVKQACATAELLSTDVADSRTVNEMMAKSDAVVVAAEYCSATLDAVEQEKKRLKSEDEDEDD